LKEKKKLAKSYSQANIAEKKVKKIPDFSKENLMYSGLETGTPLEKSYSKNEIKMEYLKQELCHREDFNIFEVYKMYFDKDSKGFITQADFDKAMEDFGVTKSYTLESHLKYSTFCGMLLPLSKEHADLAINRMPIYTKYENQNNDEDLRTYDKLVGNTYKKLKDMLKTVFEQIII